MKSLLNFSKIAITTMITASVFVACSSEISDPAYTTQYSANTSNLKKVGQAVDLGLPSGIKWADMNVGASSSTDNGVLFVWGDVTGTQVLPSDTTYETGALTETQLFEQYVGEAMVGYTYDTVNVYKESIEPLTEPMSEATVDSIKNAKVDYFKSLYSGRLEVILNATETSFSLVINALDSTAVEYNASNAGSFTEDAGATFSGIPVCNIAGSTKYDPATANWGSNWRMPSKAELSELIDNCTWEFSGNGYKVTGPNGNSIFLPAAGYRYGDEWVGNGNAGYYASGAILGTYQYPSMLDQKSGSKGTISSKESMPNMLIFQHGDFDNSVKVYNNLTTNYAVSVRPVTE